MVPEGSTSDPSLERFNRQRAVVKRYHVGAYDTVSLRITYKNGPRPHGPRGPVGKKIYNLGAHGPHGFPMGPHGPHMGPHGTPNLEFSFRGRVVRDTVS